MHNGKSSRNTYLVDRQRCYRSQGCPSIVNSVVKATLSLKRRSDGKWNSDDGVNEKAHHWAFPGDVLLVHIKCNFQALALLWNELPTVCICMSWPLLTVYLCMVYYWLVVDKHGCITHYACDHNNYGESIVLLAWWQFNFSIIMISAALVKFLNGISKHTRSGENLLFLLSIATCVDNLIYSCFY